MTLDSDSCGFCTDPTNCLCRGSDLIMQDADPPAPGPPASFEAAKAATGPGTCEACRLDPERARQCRELGQATRFSESGSVTPKDTRGDSGAGMLPPPRRSETVTCADFLQKLPPSQRHFSTGSVFGTLKAYPYMGEHKPEGHDPAMEFDSHDAAHALTALAGTPTAATPAQSA